MYQRPPPMTRSRGVRRDRGGAEPEVVIEALRHRLWRRVPAAGSVGGHDVDGLDLADVPVADQFAGETAMRAERTLLRAVLEDRSILVDRGAQSLVLLDAQAQRLLAIHVLARAHCRQRDRHVPVIGRGDHDGVDVVACQDFAKIVVRFAAFRAVAFVHHRRAGLAPILERIADGQHLALVHAQEPAEQSAALTADTNVGGGDAFAGRVCAQQDARGQNQRRRDRGAGVLEEVPTGRPRAMRPGFQRRAGIHISLPFHR